MEVELPDVARDRSYFSLQIAYALRSILIWPGIRGQSGVQRRIRNATLAGV